MKYVKWFRFYTLSSCACMCTSKRIKTRKYYNVCFVFTLLFLLHGAVEGFLIYCYHTPFEISADDIIYIRKGLRDF